MTEGYNTDTIETISISLFETLDMFTNNLHDTMEKINSLPLSFHRGERHILFGEAILGGSCHKLCCLRFFVAEDQHNLLD